MTRTQVSSVAIAGVLACVATMGQAQEQLPADDPTIAVAEEDNGRYYTADGIPTFQIDEDGTVDWLTYSGFRRYHADCHVCHGPDGEGSSYAPALKTSAVEMDYYDFLYVATEGRQRVDAANQNVMPAFGDNPNVMCYLDDIYVYLKARGSGHLPRGRPGKREDKSEAIGDAESSCLGT
jgi:methanol metabolism-related c-type cytochrome